MVDFLNVNFILYWVIVFVKIFFNFFNLFLYLIKKALNFIKRFK